ncbi:LacI family DNA-binding transcriptional regulator [Bianquea renquensis]|jgi:transcriptional regulator, lacI family|uniref:LacI family DNA-binding transcriptional regulator n=1 Tax=Bianquea renquensis TaxID=2763661 RepID=A0A926DQX9_9FIRM|nr:LacI family DNA-binding transcriptional regulator [Bianquea renquensis]MBC8543580.1 LacI family DNA-binding transcriptional regulator [Bianquea renquensis]
MANVTIKDIAIAAGVSHPTVSKALNNAPGVSDETRRKILKLAAQMNYTPNMAAKRLANKGNRSIGFIWPKAEGIFFYHLANALQEEAGARGIDVVASMSDPVTALRTFREHFIDFVMCWFFPDWRPSLDFLKERERYPGQIVVVGGGSLEGAHQIAIDRKRAVYNAVTYLAGLGHRRIAFIGEETDKSNGYLKGVFDAKLDFDPSYFVKLETTYYGGFLANHRELSQKFAALWDSPSRPTALLLDSQDAAFGFINILREWNISIPRDVSVIGYDDIPEMSIYEVPLTTCGPTVRMVVDGILDLYETQMTEDADHRKRVYRQIIPELTLRESTRELNSE